jgi:hypothetical protein
MDERVFVLSIVNSVVIKYYLKISVNKKSNGYERKDMRTKIVININIIKHLNKCNYLQYQITGLEIKMNECIQM